MQTLQFQTKGETLVGEIGRKKENRGRSKTAKKVEVELPKTKVAAILLSIFRVWGSC